MVLLNSQLPSHLFIRPIFKSLAVYIDDEALSRAKRTQWSTTRKKKRERQLTTARTNQTTGLTNGRAANWAPEVAYSPFRALSLC